MKLILGLLFAFTLGAHANATGQHITLHKKVSLKLLFEEIRKQTNYGVIYVDGAVNLDHQVSIAARNKALTQVLEDALAGTGLGYRLYNGTIILKREEKMRKLLPRIPDNHQDQVTGLVTDEQGNPLPGVTVSVVGTNRMIGTGQDGRYALDTKAGEKLRFTFMGYETVELSVTGGVHNLSMMPATSQNLDEVVVIGLGNTQRKISVVGAISTVTTKELTQSPVANLSNALAGRLPGLITRQGGNAPGSGSELFIRGISSMTGSTAPLIVVDGLPRTSGDFAQLDPNEIESVSILKDATSTSLYGIQGANGVVVVTTKRGVTGQKPAITFTGQYALQQPIRLPQMMTAEELARYDNETFDDVIWNEADLAAIRSGSDPYTYPYVNWFDYLFKELAPQQNYNINFRGGSEFAKYFVSGSYLNQSSLFDHEEDNQYGVKGRFDRYNFRSNIDLQVNKRLLLQVDVAGRLEKRKGPGPGFEDMFLAMNRTNPNATGVFNPDGSIAHGGKLFLATDWHNPYAQLTQTGYFDHNYNAMNGTFLARHDLDMIATGLSAQLLYTFQNNNFRNTSRSQGYNSYWYRGLDGSGNPIYQQARIESNLKTDGEGEVERRNYTDFRLNYVREFGDHDVTGQVLVNRTLRVNQDDLPYAYQGLSSRFTYGYADRYFAEFNLGYNGSENFPPKKRYGFFPSFSAGWVLTNEKFYTKNNAIEYLKIRGSIGLVGNDQIDDNRWLYISDYAPGDGYSFGPNPSTDGDGYNENRVGNPNVTWEKSQKLNIGFDATFANKLFNVTFDYFREHRTDILLKPETVPNYVGVNGLSARNTGEVLNQGFDGELAFVKRFADAGIFAKFQATYARNEVLNNDQPVPPFSYQNLVGHEIGYGLGLQAMGLFTSIDEIAGAPIQRFSSSVLPGDIRYADINEDGVVDAYDRVPIQDQNVPRYVFGLSMGFDYKGFDVSFLLNGATGSTTNMNGANFDFMLRGRSVWAQRWNEVDNNNAEALLPSARRSANNNQYSSFWIMQTDYLKVRNAEIGYRFPKSLLAPYGIKSVRIFANGQNLAVWDKMWIREQDPESAQNETKYPQQRIINFGITLEL